MLIRSRTRAVPLSLKMLPGSLVIRVCHDEVFLSEAVEAGGEVWREVRVRQKQNLRILYELVAEDPSEEQLLRGHAKLERALHPSGFCYTWQLEPRSRREW